MSTNWQYALNGSSPKAGGSRKWRWRGKWRGGKAHVRLWPKTRPSRTRELMAQMVGEQSVTGAVKGWAGETRSEATLREKRHPKINSEHSQIRYFWFKQL